MGFLAKLFDRPKPQTAHLSLDDLDQLIRSYGAVMETGAADIVRDTRLLPASKEMMKLKLMTAMKMSPPDEQRESLKAGYVHLSSFQPLSMDEKSAVDAYQALMAEPLDDNSSEVIRAPAKKTLALSDIVNPLLQRSADEAAALFAEFQTAKV